MAEEGGGGGNSMGIFVAFFGGIFVLWLITHGGDTGGLFGTASSSPLFTVGSTTISEGAPYYQEVPLPEPTTSQPPPLSPQEVEAGLSNAYQRVGQLKADMADAKLWGNPSPYRDAVVLSNSNAASTDPETEYLMLYSYANEPVDISGWRLESVVTGKTVYIPFGARLPRGGRISDTGRILLDRGESAYLVTGESPIGVSFHENKCTGYLAEFQDFYPSLPHQCPSPLDEMHAFGNIDLDNDRCYDFVQTLSSCRIVDADKAVMRISASCREFVENELTYSACVANHKTDPYFYQGAWHIFFEKERDRDRDEDDTSDDLWRSEREIIRLLDDTGKTVSVLTY